MKLHEVPRFAVDEDIRHFFAAKLRSSAPRAVAGGIGISENWPTTTELRALAEKADGLFIFASTAVKFILDKYNDPRGQLRLILAKEESFSGKGLDALYLDILTRAFPPGDEQLDERVRSILGFLVVAHDTPSPETIKDLFEDSSDQVGSVRRRLAG